MKRLFNFSIFLFLLLEFSPVFSQIVYTDPVNNSKYVRVNNSIIIGFGYSIDARILADTSVITITGSKTGFHTGKTTLVENNKKIIFDPDMPFEYDEKVNVKFNSIMYSPGNSEKTLYEFFFHTEKVRNSTLPAGKNREFYSYNLFEVNENFSDYTDEIPKLTVTVNNSPAVGKIFMSNFRFAGDPEVPHLIIAENSGAVYTGVKLPGNALDFKKEPNGNLVFYSTKDLKYYALDAQYKLVDSFYCGNDYYTDGHELRILNNEHALLMSYDTQTVDMSQMVPGGNENCLVIGLIIQEIDEHKNVVFQWRSWDHIPITDAQHQNMTAEFLDYIHGNAIDMDSDGNILISSRHLDEITKINRETGSIIWRFGGPGNDFTFINDPERFSFQHGIRRIANGNILLFDNGNFHTPPHSRAVEYTLDETNMTATLVWQFRNSPDNFGFAMGFAQRLDNGNTVISWGSSNPTITEVTPSGQIALELSLPQGSYTYRGFKFDWNGLPGYIDLSLSKPPVSYRLSQNYPNPFNPVSKIDFDIPENSFVSLKIYDVLGRLVSQPVNSDMRAGAYSIELNASQFASGIYFYKLSTAGFTETKKMVVVK